MRIMQYNIPFIYCKIFFKKVMPKYALIQNIGGLTCLLCHLLHFRRFSGHFVEPGLCCISSNITLHYSKYTKVGCCDAGRTSKGKT